MAEKTRCECSSDRLVGIEYAFDHPEHYDGVSEWRCMECGQRVGRWSRRILKKGESEQKELRFIYE